jgi:hypothetical protein
MTEIPAFSEKTGTEYPNFDALIQAEANGWVVVVVFTNGNVTWPWILGPFKFKSSALRAKGRTVYKFKKQSANGALPHNLTAKFFVRPAWKDDD